MDGVKCLSLYWCSPGSLTVNCYSFSGQHWQVSGCFFFYGSMCLNILKDSLRASPLQFLNMRLRSSSVSSSLSHFPPLVVHHKASCCWNPFASGWSSWMGYQKDVPSHFLWYLNFGNFYIFARWWEFKLFQCCPFLLVLSNYQGRSTIHCLTQ